MKAEAAPSDTDRDVLIADELRAAGLSDAIEVGHGGFAVVFKCLQTALDRTVAVKVLTHGLDDESRDRFFREQRAMGRLTGHPNIANVLQVGSTESGHPYIVMPYHPLDSLHTLVVEEGPLPSDQALRLGVRVAGALETAHRSGILHRDVKPGNILISSYGEPVLTDFGIAHVGGRDEIGKDTVTASPGFAAPEVFRGACPDETADVYSIGGTLYFALTGNPAFERHNNERVADYVVRIARHRLPDPREHGVDDDIATAIEHAMALRPKDRPGSAAEFGDELRAIEALRGLDVDEMALAESVPEVRIRRRDSAPVLHSGSTRRKDSVQHVTGNLPLDVSSFVGREDELAEAESLCRTARLITLTGMGGVGKTRLALRLAAQIHRNYVHGVWLAEFGEIADESVIIATVAKSLGIRTSHSDPVREVIDFLQERELLLLLDNCEHVIAPVARFVQTVIRSCPRVTVVATTREPLNIAGEALMRVPPLSTPDDEHDPEMLSSPSFDSIALFEERAAAAVSGFTLSDDNVDAVVRICRQLDGLPLPIELAAAQLRAMSLEQVAQGLNDRYSLLKHGSRAAPARHRTLRLCVEWSHELCTPVEQQIWMNLSVFAGTFELDAAEGICEGIDKDVLVDAVISLVDKSILIRDEHAGRVGFRMLGTIREFGRVQARGAGVLNELRNRHYSWYRHLVGEAEREWISSRQLAWIARLSREQPNLREALEFAVIEDSESASAVKLAVALYPFWLSRNLLSEGRFWLNRALEKHSNKASTDTVTAYYAETVLAGIQGDLAAGAELISQGDSILADMADPVCEARIDHAKGVIALYAGQAEEASRRLGAALAVFGEHREVATHVWILMMLGMSYEMQGDSKQAIACHTRVIQIAEDRGESVYRSYSLWGLGVAWFRQDDFARAAQFLAECLRLCRKIDEPLVAAVSLEVMAWIAAEEGDAAKAATLLGAAESLGSAVGSSPLLYKQLRRHHDECVRSVRSELGDRVFGLRHRRGVRLGNGAIPLALAEDDERNTGELDSL